MNVTTITGPNTREALRTVPCTWLVLHGQLLLSVIVLALIMLLSVIIQQRWIQVQEARRRNKEDKRNNRAFWLPCPCLGAPRGPCDDISLIFFFNQNEKCRFCVRNHRKFQISEVSWSSERCWRENWSTGCFLAVRASWLID